MSLTNTCEEYFTTSLMEYLAVLYRGPAVGKALSTWPEENNPKENTNCAQKLITHLTLFFMSFSISFKEEELVGMNPGDLFVLESV
jgi:hypothetical protein